MPYTFLQRLNGVQKKIIRETPADVSGSVVYLILFGSRVDDHARGGISIFLLRLPWRKISCSGEELLRPAKLSARFGSFIAKDEKVRQVIENKSLLGSRHHFPDIIVSFHFHCLFITDAASAPAAACFSQGCAEFSLNFFK
jgi:hypothetical protein